MLYPKNTDTRTVVELDGVWRFKLDNSFTEEWASSPLTETIAMQVPSSYNDIAIDEKIRHHIGWVWYERDVTISKLMLSQRLVLRFGSVTHEAKVYLNGQLVGEHKGGFTPFEIDVTDVAVVGPNRLTVAVNNILDYTTLPVGIYEEKTNQLGHVTKTNTPNFDFFNYSGIQRSVKLWATPKAYIKDIVITTDIKEDRGFFTVEVESIGDYEIRYTLFNQEGEEVAITLLEDGEYEIENARFWEPLNAYLYDLKVELFDAETLVDAYTETFGVRTVEVKEGQFLINHKPFYFKGYGKHEDTIGNGRGVNPVMDLMDLNLLKWTGANSLRTAHYPYSEEFMQLCDQLGIVVINETPAVGLTVNFNATSGMAKELKDSYAELQTMDAHKQVLEELVARDKNHPCVVMWSIANEPGSDEEGAPAYFQPLIDLTRKLDKQNRPVTIVLYMGATAKSDKVAELVDVICLNRYYGWYINLGKLEEAKMYFKMELDMWEKRCPDKPIMLTEYGADTLAGFHDVHTRAYTEEYQVNFYEATHAVVDQFQNFVGEQVWNFADFETVEGLIRVGGNKKGIFTRDRKPKAAAYSLKKRWENIPEFFYKNK